MRFRTHLALLVLGVLLPVLALAGLLLLRGAAERREAELRSLMGYAQALAAASDREIAGTLKAVEAVALGIGADDRADPERLRAPLEALLARNPSWLNFVLTRPDLSQVLNTLAPPGGALPGGAALRLSRLPNADRPDVSDPFIEPVSGVAMVAPGAPIPGSGTPPWTLGIGVRIQHFERVIAETMPVGMLAGIVDANGRFVAHSPTPQGDRTLAPAPEPVARFAAAASAGATTLVETRRVTGEPVDAALHRMTVAPWTAAVSIPRGVVDAAVGRALRDLALFGALALALALGAAALSGRHLGRRVRGLAWAAEAAGRGEVLAVPGGVAEVDRVAAALARAAEEVRAREAEVRQSGEDRLRLAHQVARIGSFDLHMGEREAVVTPEYAAISGLPPGTATDTHDAALARIHPEDRAAYAETVRVALEGGTPGYEADFRIIRPSDGAVRVLTCRAEIRRHEAGRAQRLIGVVRDVTEECAAAEELRSLNAGLEARVREEVAAREAAQARAAQAERMQALVVLHRLRLGPIGVTLRHGKTAAAEASSRSDLQGPAV